MLKMELCTHRMPKIIVLMIYTVRLIPQQYYQTILNTLIVPDMTLLKQMDRSGVSGITLSFLNSPALLKINLLGDLARDFQPIIITDVYCHKNKF